MRRVLAIAFAALLVALALVVRSRIDSGKAADEATANRPSGNLVCATELQAVCEQLGKDNPALTVRIEEAGVTYDELVKSGATATSAKIDAWLAPQPWPAMVDEARASASAQPLFDASSKVLARSPAVMVIWKDRLRALQGSCPGGVADWTCIGNASGDDWTTVGGEAGWGKVKPGIGPATNATGVFVFDQATEQYFAPDPYDRSTLESDSDYRAWATKLGQAAAATSQSGTSAVKQMTFLGRGPVDVAGTLESLALAAGVTTGRYKDELTILYPANATTADVVLAPARGSEPGGRVKQYLESNGGADAFARNGWRVDGRAPVPGVSTNDPPLPAGNGVPRAGILEAVRETWAEVQR